MKEKTSLVYIAAASPRSGTNYFFDLLARHPSCIATADGEDYFLFKLDYLGLFCDSIHEKWNDEWEIKRKGGRRDLFKALGAGLVQFLKEHPSEHSELQEKPGDVCLTKTPHARNLRAFPELFESGFLLVLIRDGRAVTESAMRTFGDSFDDAAMNWRRGARNVLGFVEKHGWSSEWHEVVKYEELVRQTTDTLRDLFGKIGLPVNDYPYESLEETEVIGSSTFGQENDVTWEKKADDGSFSPLSRYESWSSRQHERFNWIAGDELERLGYTPSPSGTSFVSPVRNLVLDVRRVPRILKMAVRSKGKEILSKYVTDESKSPFWA